MAAVDVKTKEILACRVSWAGKMIVAETFLRKVLEGRRKKLFVWVDEGTVVSWLIDRLKVETCNLRHAQPD